MGGKSSGGDTTVRYAPFLEDATQQLINYGWSQVNFLMNQPSPYSGLTVVDPDKAFLGVGYTISSYPSVFDMFGKFMAGLDVEVLYTQEQVDTVYNQPINDSIAAESALLDADLNATSYPRFEAGMLDMNAANSTGFMMGRAYIEDGATRYKAKYAADLRLHAMDLGHQRWNQHLQWNAQVISHYLSIISNYLKESHEYLSQKAQIATGNDLWVFSLLDHQRAIIGTLNGAHAAAVKRDSGFAKVVSGALGVASLLTSPTLTKGLGTLLGVGGPSASALSAGTGAASGAGLTWESPQNYLNMPGMS